MNKNLYRLIAGNYRSAEIQLRGECIKIIKCLTICFILGLIAIACLACTIYLIFTGNILTKERSCSFAMTLIMCFCFFGLTAL